MKKRVVIVDDDESIRKTFYLILNSDYMVYLAKDAEEMLQRFQGTEIDLIIADLKLPHLNGLDMITKFRKTGYKGEVILISAYPDLLDPEILSRLEVGHVFVKPLDLDALNEAIAHLLSSENTQRKAI
ncbi:MAG: response regulator [Candidatus Aminicenantes bacterium]|nr:MAG: response regulator [Candidatus Aminicenantes bacterium]